MKILYVVYSEILAPVVRSQTLPLLKGLRRRGHEPHLLVFTSPRRVIRARAYATQLEVAEAAVNGNLHVISHLPKHVGFNVLAWRLRRLLNSLRPDVVHARQSRAGLLAGRAGIAPVLLDMRGLRPEEYLMTTGKEEGALDPAESRQLALLRSQDAEAIRRANAVVCVSKPFKRHLGGGSRTIVIPNASAPIPTPSNGARDAMRQKLGIRPDETAFVYSGSLAPWQCADATARLFTLLQRHVENVRFVLLTHHAPEGERLAAAAGIERAIVRSLTPEATRALLPAFDVAFLLRERNPVNEVAAPVKFGEYLNAGLPVVLTEGIGDASEWVDSEGLGVVLESPSAKSNLARVVDAMGSLDAARCRAFGRSTLTFESTLPLYERALSAAVENG